MSTTSTPHVEADHDNHLMTIALTARLTEGSSGLPDVSPLTPTRFWECLSQMDGDLSAASHWRDADVGLLAGRATAAALHSSELEAQGITLLTPYHGGYPTRYMDVLGSVAPPLLYVAGDPNLLSDDRRRLAVVGSRHASEEDLIRARDVTRCATSKEWQVVSGGAKGTDAVALNTAVEVGGPVVAIMTEGVRRAMRKATLRRLVRDGGAVIVSPVHPDTGFRTGNAMARNKLIYALASVTYVAAVEEGRGGTWSGATEALRRGFGQVVVNADAVAADALRAKGARVMKDVEDVFLTWENDNTAVVSETESGGQITLFD